MSVLPAEAATAVSDWLGADWRAQPLAGDASVRAYYRITTPGGQSCILAWYPEEVRGELQRALSAYATLAAHVPLPPVLRASDEAVLQFDAGDRTIFDVLHADRDEGIRLYRRAVGLLPRLQATPDPGLHSPFSADFFRTELEMTREFFVEALLGNSAGGLDDIVRKICTEIATHPYVLCHRDYHGQNIHVINDDLYVIDYQDLRMGPDTYDLASLLRDRGVARIIGETQELAFVDSLAEAAGAREGIRRRYFATLLQRSLKVLGTFAKQPIARGRMHYLEFIPAALEAIDRCVGELPEFEALRDIVPVSIDLDEARARAEVLHRKVEERGPQF